MNFRMNFRYSVIYIFFLCLLLPACKQSNDATSFKKKRQRSTRQFDVRIHGVECDLCAQSAIDDLKNIKGICDVECDVIQDDYEHAVFHVYYMPDQSVSLETINDVLERDQFCAELLA